MSTPSKHIQLIEMILNQVYINVNINVFKAQNNIKTPKQTIKRYKNHLIKRKNFNR